MKRITFSSKWTLFNKYATVPALGLGGGIFIWSGLHNHPPLLYFSGIWFLALILSIPNSLRLKAVTYDGSLFEISNGFQASAIHQNNLIAVIPRRIISPARISLIFSQAGKAPLHIHIQPPIFFGWAKHDRILGLLSDIAKGNQGQA